MSTVFERFNTKWVLNQTNGCWEWVGANDGRGGYGKFCYHGKQEIAHRVSYELFIGSIPAGEGYHGVCVCHKCDNKRCVNPEHLFLSDQKGNMVDAVNKKRHKGRLNLPPSVGEQQWRSKLTEQDIRLIRKLYSKGELTQADLAKKFDVSRANIGKIVNKIGWKHIGE